MKKEKKSSCYDFLISPVLVYLI